MREKYKEEKEWRDNSLYNKYKDEQKVEEKEEQKGKKTKERIYE